MFHAWNEALPLVIHLAKAHCERIVVEKFTQVVRELPPRLSTGPMLHVLCALYALCKIEEDMGWYMTNRYFSPRKAKAIEQEICRLCKVLRPLAWDLIEAFDIPEKIVQAPIAFDYDAANQKGKVPGEFAKHWSSS